MIVQHITDESAASVTLDEKKHIQLPEHDVRTVLMLALSVRNDLTGSTRVASSGSLPLELQKLDEMVDHLSSFLNRKPIDTYQISSFTFIKSKKLLRHDTFERVLTQIEIDILTLLCEQKDLLVERDELLNHVWGHSDFYTSRSLDVYIHRLRKYFAIDSAIKIETVHRKGFKFSLESEDNFSAIST